MPHEHPYDVNDGVAEHLALTPNERRLLGEVARGASDREISEVIGQTEVSVRSGLRRFRDRTGLAGRRLVVWAVIHWPCCVNQSPIGDVVRATFPSHMRRRDVA